MTSHPDFDAAYEQAKHGIIDDSVVANLRFGNVSGQLGKDEGIPVQPEE